MLQLYARLQKAKPDFSKAMPPQKARQLYAQLIEHMRESYAGDRVKDGVFGAMMSVSLVNEGPVTLIIDSAAPAGSSGSLEGLQ